MRTTRATTRRSRRVAIIGAGPGGICTAVESLARGPRRLRDPGEGARHRRHVVPQPLPGCRVRHQVAPLLVLVRAQPRVVPPLRPPARDQGVPRGRRRPLRARAPHPPQHAGPPHASGTTTSRCGTSLVGDGEVGRRRGRRQRGRHVRRTRRHRKCPASTGSRARCSTPAQWVDDHDLSGERVAVIGSAASAVQLIPEIAPIVGSLDRVPAHRELGVAQGRRPVLRGRAGGVRRRPRRACSASRDEIFTTIDPNLTFSDTERRSLDEAVRAAQHRGRWRTEELRARAHPGRAVRLPSDRWRRTSTTRRSTCRTSSSSPTPITEVTEHGIVTADGTTREVDTIILATGFTTTKFLAALDVDRPQGPRHRRRVG